MSGTWPECRECIVITRQVHYQSCLPETPVPLPTKYLAMPYNRPPHQQIVYILPNKEAAVSRNRTINALAKRLVPRGRGKRLTSAQTSRAKDSITYSVPFNAARRLTISRFSLAFSFFTRAASSPCSLSFSINSSLSSFPLPLRALTILPSSPLNFS